LTGSDFNAHAYKTDPKAPPHHRTTAPPSQKAKRKAEGNRTTPHHSDLALWSVCLWKMGYEIFLWPLSFGHFYFDHGK